MSKFGRWGLTVVTMVSVATVVFLVTGWGSAVASSLSTSVIVGNSAANPVKVHEQGNANVNITNASVPVSGSVALTGTPSVSVGNFPSAPATVVIASGHLQMALAEGPWTLVPMTDVSAYRAVTFDVAAADGESDASCSNQLQAGSEIFRLPYILVQAGHFVSQTYDAPPSIAIICQDNYVGPADIKWALVGRTG